MATDNPANHSLIIANLLSQLRQTLEQNCYRVFDGGARVCAALDGPDIAVIRGAPEFADGSGEGKETLHHPLLLVEVLAPSTEGHDRGVKARQYRSIKSLREYVLVSQTEPSIEIYRRSGDEWFLTDVAGLESLVELPSLNCRVPLAEIYAKVEFEAA